MGDALLECHAARIVLATGVPGAEQAPSRARRRTKSTRALSVPGIALGAGDLRWLSSRFRGWLVRRSGRHRWDVRQRGEELSIDLTAADAAGQWSSWRKRPPFRAASWCWTAARRCRGRLLPLEWRDVSCGPSSSSNPPTRRAGLRLVVRARDADTYYYVHFDRGQAILCVPTRPVVERDQTRRRLTSRPASGTPANCRPRRHAARVAEWQVAL